MIVAILKAGVLQVGGCTCRCEVVVLGSGVCSGSILGFATVITTPNRHSENGYLLCFRRAVVFFVQSDDVNLLYRGIALRSPTYLPTDEDLKNASLVRSRVSPSPDPIVPGSQPLSQSQPLANTITGYWRGNVSQTHIRPCLFPEACIGGTGISPSAASSTDSSSSQVRVRFPTFKFTTRDGRGKCQSRAFTYSSIFNFLLEFFCSEAGLQKNPTC